MLQWVALWEPRSHLFTSQLDRGEKLEDISPHPRGFFTSEQLGGRGDYVLILDESAEWLLLGVVSLMAVIKDHPLQYLRMK